MDQIQKLRKKTDAKMIDCKNALMESSGDMPKAEEWLRKKGAITAAKLAGSAAGDGVVVAGVSQGQGWILEINCQTDFVSRAPEFRSFVKNIFKTLCQLEEPTLEKLKNTKFLTELSETNIEENSNGSITVGDQCIDMVGRFRENIVIQRLDHLAIHPGSVASYVHSSMGDGLGKIGVLLAMESTLSHDILQDIGKKICMHIAASNSLYLRREDVPSDMIEKEKTFLMEQVQKENKPQEILQKMVEGRLNKFFQDIVLEEQDYALETGKTIKTLVDEFAKIHGAPIILKAFVKFVLGQGAEEKEITEAL